MKQATNPIVITVAMDEIMIGILEEEEESAVVINNDCEICSYII